MATRFGSLALRRAGGVFGIGILALTLIPADPLHAADQMRRRLVVTQDYGGDIAARSQRIAQMYATGQSVAVTSGKCLSACTMYLGLPGTCVGPNAVFGFHGPAGVGGRPLSAADFDAWSRIMSIYYPPQLRDWFMSEARYRTSNYIPVSGAQLIRMGVPQC